MKIYPVEGGLGKNIAFTALLPELAKKEKVIIQSSYPDVYYNNPYVYRSITNKTQYAYEDYFQKHEICYFEPYWDNAYIKGNTHLLKSWSNGYKVDFKKVGLPKVFLSELYKQRAKQIKKELGKFIVVQFSGGQSPLKPNLKKNFKNLGQRKDYDIVLAQQVINLLRDRYKKLSVIDYTLPNEGPGLQGAKGYTLPYLVYAELLRQSEGFIAIDSSLQHLAASVNKPGVVLWGATGPHQLGYSLHRNLTNRCPFNTPHCMRPYLRWMGDINSAGQGWCCPNPQCINIDPELIVDTFEKITPLSSKDKGKFSRLSYIIGTGWWCDDTHQHKGSGLNESTDLTRRPEMFNLWKTCINKFTAPEKIIVVDSNSPIKPDVDYGVECIDPCVELISMSKNFGHALNARIGGDIRAIFLAASYALVNDVDYFVYVEQDCLISGDERFVDLAIKNMNPKNGISFGLTSSNLKSEFSFIVMHKSKILLFIQKYTTLVKTENNLPEINFYKLSQDPDLNFTPLKMGYGRDRPINFKDSYFYAQHWTADELKNFVSNLGFKLEDFFPFVNKTVADRCLYLCDSSMNRSDLMLFEKLLKEKNPKNVLEIGSFKGGSTVCIGRTCEDAEVTVLDTFKGTVYKSGTFKETLSEDMFSIFEKNTSFMKDRLKVYKTRSSEALITLRTKKYDLIFIDGDHSYEAVKADILACKELLNSGGWIIGHDYHKKWGGVIKAVGECFKTFLTFKKSGSSLWVFKS